MPQYMLLMYNPVEGEAAWRKGATGEEGGVSAEEFAAARKLWQELHQELQQAGVLVDNNGLAGIEAATTVRVRDGETQITDGPFAETKEILAGYFVLDVPDLDTALTYAAKVPTAAYGSVEVRPVWSG
jgi:hypothetical protein